MNQIEIANLEAAGRSAMAWVPDGPDTPAQYRRVLTAIVPAAGILAVAATLLLAVL